MLKIPAEPDFSGFQEKASAETRRVKADPVHVPVETDAGKFEQDFHAAMAESEKAVAEADAEMRRSFSSIESGSRSLRSAMGELDPEARRAEGALGDMGRAAEGAGRSAGNAGAGAGLGAIGMRVLYGAAVALAPALAALPALAGAVAVGGGVMVAGFSGVIKALRDYGAQAQATGQSSAQLAQTQFQNAVAIRNAEQAIADAKKQAARSAQDSAEAIANAEQGLSDAYRSAAQASQASADQIYSANEHVASAAYSLAQAEQRLTDAEDAELDAQKALTQARADAENQLKDLNNSAADAHLTVERATLNVTKAQDSLRMVMSNSMSTDTQKKDAQLALAEAQQALIDAQQHSVEATQKADQANKAGVDGMQNVVSAQDAVTRAAQGVKDAQHGVSDALQAQADAQKALARAVQASADQQATSAESIKKAQQGVADAEKQAARSRADSAESIRKAEQGLSDTYKQQQLAAAVASQQGSAAADAFKKDMANLTPQAQDFVKQLLSMKDGARQLSQTAQTAMMPGLTQMLKDSTPLLPVFNGAFADMGKVIGGTALQFGALMKSPAFQGQLTQVLKDGAGFAKQFGDGLVGLVGGVMQAAAGAGPIVSGLGAGVKDMMTQGIPDFFKGLVTNATGVGQAIQGIFDIVSGLLGPIGTLFGGIVGALGPALHDLEPHFKSFVDAIVRNLMPAMPPLGKALDAFAKGLGQILDILQPVIPLIARVLTDGLKVLGPILEGIAWLLEHNHGWLSKLFDILGYGLTPLSLFDTAVNFVHDHMKGWWKFLSHMWSDIAGWFSEGWGKVQMVWGKIEDWVKTAWNKVYEYTVQPVKDAYDWVTGKWDDMITWVKGLPGKLAAAGSGMWDWIKETFKNTINIVIGWWDGLKFSMPSLDLGPLGSIGGWTIGVPQITPLHAAGGPLGPGVTAAIGDNGWEPLRLPNGTTVIPHANAQAMLAAGAGAGMGGGQVEVRLVWDLAGADDDLIRLFRHRIRAIAGNSPNSVQKALGQAF